MSGYTAEEWQRYETRRKNWSEYCATDPYEFAESLAIMFAPKGADRILDVACGDGTFLHGLSKLFPKADTCGIDGSQAALQKASDLGHYTLRQSLDDLAPPGQHDIITCLFALYHADDPKQVFATMAAHLKPGGILITSTISAFSQPSLWDSVSASDGWWKNTGLEAFKDNDGWLWMPESGLRVVNYAKYYSPIKYPDHNALKDFIASTLTRSHLAENVTPDTPLESWGEFIFTVGRKE